MNSPLARALHHQQLNEVIDLIQNQNVDLCFNDNYLIRYCCEKGYTEIIRILLSEDYKRKINSAVENNYCLGVASLYGHLEIVALLLADERVTPYSDWVTGILTFQGKFQKIVCHWDGSHPQTRNSVVMLASAMGHLEIVKLLLKDARVDPSDQSNMAVISACLNGHHEVVRLLMTDSRVDISEDCNFGIERAAMKDDLEMVKILCTDKRVNKGAGLVVATGKSKEFLMWETFRESVGK